MPTLLLLLGLSACGTGTVYDTDYDPDPGEADAGVALDAAPPQVDSAARAVDAAPPLPDAAPPQVDAAPPEPDAAIINADFCETSGEVVMEAEEFTTQNGYAAVSRSDASGGVAMQVGSSGSLDFEIHLATGGTYYFWVRTLAPDSESNGMYVALDGAHITAPPSNPYAGVADIYLLKSSSQWYWEPRWQGPGSGETQGPVTFTASAGVHVLSIQKRKMERPLIDRIVLTLANQPPSGLGPAETPCP